jgi:hypothetical protein
MTDNTALMEPALSNAKRELQDRFAERVVEDGARKMRTPSQFLDYTSSIDLANGFGRLIENLLTSDIEMATVAEVEVVILSARAPMHSWLPTYSLAAEEAADAFPSVDELLRRAARESPGL